MKIVLDDRPGMLADMGEALGKAGVNIEGICGIPYEGKGVIHLLVEDVASAHKALKEAGIEVKEERPVLVLDVSDRPGELGGICRRIAEMGVNINLVYAATKTRLILGVSDLEKARSAVS